MVRCLLNDLLYDGAVISFLNCVLLVVVVVVVVVHFFALSVIIIFALSYEWHQQTTHSHFTFLGIEVCRFAHF